MTLPQPSDPAPAADRPLSTRTRLLRAADEIATECGAGMVSLDAVAARAGVSKGGLLYHFPTKGRLLQALVGEYLARIEAMLDDSARDTRPDAVLLALIDHFLADWRCHPATGGLLAALAEDPAILAPVADFQARVLARVRANASDPLLAELVHYAMQGWHSGRMLGMHVPQTEHLEALFAALRTRLAAHTG